MSERRRVQRQPCQLDGRIFVSPTSGEIPCRITDISALGAYVLPGESRAIPSSFALVIGESPLPRACRIARREAEGFGVEFLDPIRFEVEEILSNHAFREELLFEALSPSLRGEPTPTWLRLNQTARAIMDLIEGRGVMTWQPERLTESAPRSQLTAL